MKTKIFIVFFLTASVIGAKAQQLLDETLWHDGLEREYLLYIPDSYNPEYPTPLVLSFHGFNSSAQVNYYYTGFHNIADTAGFILIHPQGTLYQGMAHWNVGGFASGSTVDDVGFTNALIDTVSATYNIDQSRVFSVGMSNGGYMSFLLACQLSNRIAAAASVTGSMTNETYAECNPQHPTPIMQIHGTADGVVPYGGNPSWTLSIDEVLAYWVGYNNCDTTPIVTSLPDIDPNDGSTVEHYYFGDGDHCVAVEHYKVLEGGHDWPGAFGNMDIDAGIEAWKFFYRYDINGLIGCNNTAIRGINHASNVLDFYPNPATKVVHLNRKVNTQVTFFVYTVTGNMVLEGVLNPGEQTIDISSLPPNVYIFRLGHQTAKLIITTGRF